MKRFIRSWRDAVRCLSDAAAARGLVFYAEGDGYAPFLRPVIDALADVYDGTVCYLSSDAADRMLLAPPAHVRPFYIGKGSARTYALNHLRAGVLAMTMPDLNTFHIRRSGHVGHYAYLHHSLVSTHMVYRKGAFDHFDSMLCTGPHHNEEVREWEALHSLPQKRLFDHGHPPLDTLIELARQTPAPPVRGDGTQNVLLAPSWGPQGLMETQAERTVQILLDAGHFVRIRPHPRTRQLSGRVIDALAATFAGHAGFDMNEDTTRYEALLQSHVMVSDWSGVAMEFAFGLERPVLFVDVPRKVNNPDYDTIAATPLEVSYRGQVGRIIAPDRLDDLPAALTSLQKDAPSYEAKLRELRGNYFYHVGASARRGAEILAALAADHSAQE